MALPIRETPIFVGEKPNASLKTLKQQRLGPCRAKIMSVLVKPTSR